MHENVHRFDTSSFDELLSNCYVIVYVCTHPRDMSFGRISRPRIFTIMFRDLPQIVHNVQDAYQHMCQAIRETCNSPPLSPLTHCFLATVEQLCEGENRARRRNKMPNWLPDLAYISLRNSMGADLALFDKNTRQIALDPSRIPWNLWNPMGCQGTYKHVGSTPQTTRVCCGQQSCLESLDAVVKKLRC